MIFVASSIILTRIKNPNLEYSKDGTATWKWTRNRFQSGREFGSRSQKMGQTVGHLSRILDSSHSLPSFWVPMDFFFLFRELRQSGWRYDNFCLAIDRISRSNHHLLPLLILSKRLLAFLELDILNDELSETWEGVRAQRSRLRTSVLLDFLLLV